jgi:transposase
MKRTYPTDLSDEEWNCLEAHVPALNKRRRPKTYTTREVLDAIFYVLKNGRAWRLAPRLPAMGGRLLWERPAKREGTAKRSPYRPACKVGG